MNHWKPKLVLAAGLALCAAGFVMLDRGWLVELWPPVGPIEQTFAAATGAVGLVLCVAGRFLYARRSAARDDGGDGPRADESPIEDSN